MRPSVMMTLLFSTLALAGCGKGFADLCEEAKKCPGANQYAFDCAEAEDAFEKLNDVSDCDDEYDTSLECLADLEDICSETQQKSCTESGQAYYTCINTYCTNNPNSAECAEVAQMFQANQR